MFFRWTMALAALAFLAAHPADAQVNKQKPKNYDSGSKVEATGIFAPDGSGMYFFREVYTCKAKWYSDGMLKDCFSPPETKRTRLEGPSSSSYDSVPGDRVYYDPGPGAEVTYHLTGPNLLLVYKDEKVITVDLPSGKQTVTAHTGFSGFEGWPSMPLYLVTDDPAGTRPFPFRWVLVDGTITAPIANSDLGRLVARGDGPEGCTERSGIAAAPPESTAIDGWTQIHRRALLAGGGTGPADLSADGTPTEKCARYMSHFFLGQRESDSQWHVLRAYDGEPVGAAFASAEAAEAAASGLLSSERLGLYATVPYGDTAMLATVSDAQKQLYADNAAAAEAAEAARIAAEEAKAAESAAFWEAQYAIARQRAEQYFAAGHYGMAAQEAESLPADEYARYVAAWRTAPASEIRKALDGLDSQGVAGQYTEHYSTLDNRYRSLVLCEGYLNGADGRPLSAQRTNRWNSTPPVNRAQEMITLLSQNQYGMLSPGEILVFDASLYEWVKIYEPDPTRRSSGTRVINIPGDGVADAATQELAEQNYQACVANAQSN